MNFFQILGSCPTEIADVMAIVKWVINIICWVIPVILIVLCVLDIAKIVTAGNIDDKLKKEVTNRIVTRIVFAIIIFLVPTIIKFLFNFVPVKDKDKTINGATWKDCWDYNVSTSNN
jgi:hypothetical protein